MLLNPSALEQKTRNSILQRFEMTIMVQFLSDVKIQNVIIRDLQTGYTLAGCFFDSSSFVLIFYFSFLFRQKTQQKAKENVLDQNFQDQIYRDPD